MTRTSSTPERSSVFVSSFLTPLASTANGFFFSTKQRNTVISISLSTNIRSVVHILECDMFYSCICLFKSFGQIFSCGSNTKYTTTICQILSICLLCSGMIYRNTFVLAVFIKTGNLITLFIMLWITAGCLNDTGTGTIRPFNIRICQC